MLWFTLWFMVILKIPILYLGWVIWWAVKNPPEAYAGAAPSEDGGGAPWRPPVRRGGPRRPERVGPHGSPPRRPERARFARAERS
jgi:hypothetical protein